MKRSELLKSKEYWTVMVQNELFNVMEGYMKKKKLNRSQLATKLNVTKGYITQILNGDFDHKISKLVDIALECDKVPVITFVDLEKYIKDDKEDRPHYLDNIHKRPIQYNSYFQVTSDFNINIYNENSFKSPVYELSSKNEFSLT